MYLSYLTSDSTTLDLERPEYIVEMEHLAEDATRFYQLSAISIFCSNYLLDWNLILMYTFYSVL